jgi:hypothetical protein
MHHGFPFLKIIWNDAVAKNLQVYPEKSLNDNWGYFNLSDQVLDLSIVEW